MINQLSSAQVSPEEIAAYLAAQNRQLSGEFAAAWKLNYFIDDQPGGIPVYLLDISDAPGAIGYHDVDGKNMPYAKVFVQSSLNDGVPWQIVASHEVLEMAVNPGPVFKTIADSNGDLWDVEVGDPVADINYKALNAPEPVDILVSMSDFAFPAWWVSGSASPWDHKNILLKDHGLTIGGYATKNGVRVVGPLHKPFDPNSNSEAVVNIDAGYVRKDRRPKP